MQEATEAGGEFYEAESQGDLKYHDSTFKLLIFI